MKNLALALLTSAVMAYNNGPIDVKVEKEHKTLYVVSNSAFVNLLEVKDDAVTLKHGARAYLGMKPLEDLTYENYYDISLFDTELSYDVDLSTVGCSCNAALYFVAMPGYNKDKQIDKLLEL